MQSSERKRLLLITDFVLQLELKSGRLQISIWAKKWLITWTFSIRAEKWPIAWKCLIRSKTKTWLVANIQWNKKVVCRKFLIGATKKRFCHRWQLSPISQRCQHFSGGKIFLTHYLNIRAGRKKWMGVTFCLRLRTATAITTWRSATMGLLSSLWVAMKNWRLGIKVTLSIVVIRILYIIPHPHSRRWQRWGSFCPGRIPNQPHSNSQPGRCPGVPFICNHLPGHVTCHCDQFLHWNQMICFQFQLFVQGGSC